MGYSKEQVVELVEELECKIVDIDCINSGTTDIVVNEIKNHLKRKGLLPSFDVGKWYKSGFGGVFYITELTSNNQFRGYGVSSNGDWWDSEETIVRYSPKSDKILANGIIHAYVFKDKEDLLTKNEKLIEQQKLIEEKEGLERD